MAENLSGTDPLDMQEESTNIALPQDSITIRNEIVTKLTEEGPNSVPPPPPGRKAYQIHSSNIFPVITDFRLPIFPVKLPQINSTGIVSGKSRFQYFR